jgi:bloom syndrome protein
MIDQDQALSKAQKDRQKAAMADVTNYCNNKTDCRRVQVLSFFGEKFDPANCNNGCDTCLPKEEDKVKYVNEEVTDDACKMLELLQAFEPDERITQLDLVKAFRGTGGNGDKNLGANPHFGVGSDWQIGEAQRLIMALYQNGGLKGYVTRNGAGYLNDYVTVSSCLSLSLHATSH